MAIQYRCKNEKRRQILSEVIQAHSTDLNGIDYLEVLDQDAPDETTRQYTLLVHMLGPAPLNLSAGDVEITGGVRVKSIGVKWVMRADKATQDLVDKGQITSTEQAYFTSLGDLVLVVRTDARGDFSTYKLRLIQPGATDLNSGLSPSQRFDPILSEVKFSFKVECPNEFDCQPKVECPPQSESQPLIDYLSKDYASFRQLMLDRLSVVMPGWQERNAADLGIAIVEVLAYAADYISYYQDAVGTEAYLGTARKRISIRRHARLLDYRMHEGCNARTWIHFDVVDTKAGIALPKSTPLLTHIDGIPPVIKPDLSDWDRALSQQPVVFETMHDAVLYSDHNEIKFYTWGDEDCCLPRGATCATLTGNLSNLQKGDVLIFVEKRSSMTFKAADADITHRHAVRLSKEPVLSKDPLFQDSKVTEIEWMAEDALPFPFCLRMIPQEELGQNKDTMQPVSIALGNIVLADHGNTITPDPHGNNKPEDADPAPFGGRRRLRLKNIGLTHSEIYSFEDRFRDAEKKNTAEAVYQNLAASRLLTQDAHMAMPVVLLDVQGKDEKWRPQIDLLNSDRFAQEFVVEMEEDGWAYLRFGDDIYGKKPVDGTGFMATYRIGNGQAGNVGAESIFHVVTNLDGILDVHNPLPAQGGTNPESLQEVRQYAPQAFRTQERAITEADYAEVAQRHPEVQKAVATRRWTGSWYTMFLTIDRKGGFEVDSTFRCDLVRFLERYRLAGQDLEIEGPVFVPLDFCFTVCVKPGYFRSDIKQTLLDVFSSQDLPDGRRGFFHPDNFTFGQKVYLSKILGTGMQVPGVRWISTAVIDDKSKKPTGNRFQRWGQLTRGEIDNGWIDIGRLEIARLDNDLNAPENGKLDFIMEGGL